MYIIAKSFEFSASHQLDHLPEGHKCARLHGHNYKVELILQSDKLDEHDFVLDYGKLDSFKQFIDTNFDHQHLNETFAKYGISGQPTAEKLAHYFFWYAHRLFLRKVKAVRVSETGKTWAEYTLPAVAAAEPGGIGG